MKIEQSEIDLFKNSKDMGLYMKMHHTIKEKWGVPHSALSSLSFALDDLCEIIINQYRYRFKIDDVKDLIENSSFSHSIQKDIIEIISPLISDKMKEFSENCTRVYK